MRDAVRPFDVNVFKVKIEDVLGNIHEHYFISRLELGYKRQKGNTSVYERFRVAQKILNGKDPEKLRESTDTIKEI